MKIDANNIYTTKEKKNSKTATILGSKNRKFEDFSFLHIFLELLNKINNLFCLHEWRKENKCSMTPLWFWCEFVFIAFSASRLFLIFVYSMKRKSHVQFSIFVTFRFYCRLTFATWILFFCCWPILYITKHIFTTRDQIYDETKPIIARNK